MKVLHLIDSGGMYGAERMLVSLMKEQVRKGIIAVLGSIRSHKELFRKAIEVQAKSDGVQVKEFSMRNGPNIAGAIRIVRFSQENNIDIIHCHGYKANILMGLMPAYYRKIPYIVTLHGWTSRKPWTRIWIYEWVDALMGRRADRVVMVSNALQRDLRVRLAGLKGHVVHNGIPVSSSELETGIPVRPDIKDFCEKDFIIGTICRLTPEKGIEILIQSVANVIHRNPNVSMVIIGDGRERRRLERLCDTKGIRAKVLFTGYISDASSYLPIFDIFVISSFTEGLPIGLLEAMRAGRPVIATNVGGIPEALNNGECGILVDSGNDDELTEAILRLYSSEDLRKTFGDAGKKRFEEQFSLKKMEPRYREIYKEVCS